MNSWVRVRLQYFEWLFLYMLGLQIYLKKRQKRENKLWRITKKELQNKNYKNKNYEIWD